MAKRKKKRSSKHNKGRSNSGERWVEKQMAQVEALQQAQAYDEAFKLLLTVVKTRPRHRIVLSSLIHVAIEMKNWRAVVTYSERLYPMESGDERAAALNNLMAAYLRLQLPALTCKTASMLLADHPDFDFISSAEKLLQEMQPRLLESFTQIELLSESFQGDQDKMFAFMVEHDQMRFCAKSGQNRETIVRCRRLLGQIPEFVPALNNASLAYFMEGDIEKAIETTRQVLAQEPDNFHALSNLTRYSFLMGETEAAWGYARQFKNLENDSPERWLKEAEALSYLGDHEGVRAAYLATEQYSFLKSPLLLHLAAAAHYRLGDESAAWPLWEEALQLDPSLYMAKASLAEREKAPHERDVGWYWPLGYWFTGNFQGSFEKHLPKSKRKGRVKEAIKKLLKQYPQLPLLAPHILDRGDPPARKTILSLIEILEALIYCKRH